MQESVMESKAVGFAAVIVTIAMSIPGKLPESLARGKQTFQVPFFTPGSLYNQGG